ncbi:hypothetical protein MSG28_015924 [Choristoneura fumiferana]|uniref:Uncharacterized protein n=1 Tax=Choristoneura fumiferana TaxID=7141 RepID=A0ACC0K4K6_CHOFU|nr:hypothetical protein MSG28_015924 [Choristoneura fumiferana]
MPPKPTHPKPKQTTRGPRPAPMSKPATSKPLRDLVLEKETAAAAAANPLLTPPPQDPDAIADMEKIQSYVGPRSTPASPKTDEGDMSDSSVISMSPGTHLSRKSLLMGPGRKGPGIEMDHATKLANTMLQEGKTALELAGNMKRECKVKCLDCLQVLYETALSLSDSRSRHKYNLERERARNAHEIVRLERLHAREMVEVREKVVVGLEQILEVSVRTAKQTDSVRNWLGYETETPFKTIGEIRDSVEEVMTAVTKLGSGTDSSDSAQVKRVEEDVSRLHLQVTQVSNQLDEMRKTLDKLANASARIPQTIEGLMPIVKEASEETPRENGAAEAITNLARKIDLLTATTEELKALGARELQPTMPEPAEFETEFRERLEAISSDMRCLTEEVRSESRRPVAPPSTLNTELALAELKDSVDAMGREVAQRCQSGPVTYAQVLKGRKGPPIPNNNHTVIVSSKDPTKTSEGVLLELDKAVSAQTTGMRLEGVRKARNQKVVVNCASQNDLELLRKAAEGKLNAEYPRMKNPLVCIRDVLNYHKDEDLPQMLLAQNKHLLSDLKIEASDLKLRYRKRARNPLCCHPVFELPPAAWKRLVEAEKVYIGLQRQKVEDQSPLVQCTRCLAYGHTKTLCREVSTNCRFCLHCHGPQKCPQEQPVCINCTRAGRDQAEAQHEAFSQECRERQKWDALARSRIAYCC